MAGKPGNVPVLDANYVVGAPKEQKKADLGISYNVVSTVDMLPESRTLPSHFERPCYYCCHFCRDDGMPQK